MSELTHSAPSTSSSPNIHVAGRIAKISGAISAVGIVFFIGLYALYWTPFKELGLTFGLINDICVTIQYLLTIPIALALYRILVANNPTLIRIATAVGLAGLASTVGLQLLCIFGVLTFEQQIPWIALAIVVGVGSWLVITGLVARSTDRLPKSVLMSVLAVPYFGYPLWAFWLGRRLSAW